VCAHMANENEGGVGADKTNDKSGGNDAPEKTGAGAAAGGEGEGTPKTYTQADLDAALALDRQERKRAATAKASTTKKQTKADEGESDEAAELRKRAEAAEAQLLVRDSRERVERAAKDAGFVNPAKIYRLIKDDLTFDEAGKPENLKDLLTIAKRDYAEELRKKTEGSADAGAKGGAGAGSGMNDIIRGAFGR
jgi:hypothetical protein